jgi:hypothetical protein
MYYDKILPFIENCLSRTDNFVALGDYPSTGIKLDFGCLEEKSNLEKVLQYEPEIFMPLIGSDAILSTFDFELSLENMRELYENKDSHHKLYTENIIPVAEHIMKKLPEHLLDLTPSGGHFMFWIEKDSNVWNQVKELGYLEDDLVESYQNGSDPRERDIEYGLIYSGLGKLWEYIAHDAKSVETPIPVTISDPLQNNTNMDITQYAYPVHMRHIRIPASIHRKRQKILGGKYIVDVLYDGTFNLELMWSPMKAANYFSAQDIPIVNSIPFIEEYKSSKLYEFHKDFENTDPVAANYIIEQPNPQAKDPKFLKPFITQLLEEGLHPRHIGSIITQFYESDYGWEEDWSNLSAETRGNFWARVYSFDP